MPLDNRLDNHHDCTWSWNVVARPLGYETGIHFAMSSFVMLDFHLLWYGYSCSTSEGPMQLMIWCLNFLTLAKPNTTMLAWGCAQKKLERGYHTGCPYANQNFLYIAVNSVHNTNNYVGVMWNKYKWSFNILKSFIFILQNMWLQLHYQLPHNVGKMLTGAVHGGCAVAWWPT